MKYITQWILSFYGIKLSIKRQTKLHEQYLIKFYDRYSIWGIGMILLYDIVGGLLATSLIGSSALIDWLDYLVNITSLRLIIILISLFFCGINIWASIYHIILFMIDTCNSLIFTFKEVSK